MSDPEYLDIPWFLRRDPAEREDARMKQESESGDPTGDSTGLLDADLAILHHSMGIIDPAEPDRAPYRNHFVADEGHDDMPALVRLEKAGLMKRTTTRLTTGWVFVVTESGQALALRTRPRLPKKKLRYHRFMNLQDVIPDLTFREFLTDPQWSEYR